MNDDLISRRAVLELAKDIIFKYPDGTEYKHRCIDPDDVRKLPSAEKRGKWVFDGCGTSCSECGYRPKLSGGWNYCPVCGARMDKE